jgi:hypothetical protein
MGALRSRVARSSKERRVWVMVERGRFSGLMANDVANYPGSRARLATDATPSTSPSGLMTTAALPPQCAQEID